mmetsp:Transcript_58918/g.105067  ORF Transcript_58918/g.105067 Transcript_58918/m.105067 type:complete len:286 (-) Transcript_58918:86-943(-)
MPNAAVPNARVHVPRGWIVVLRLELLEPPLAPPAAVVDLPTGQVGPPPPKTPNSEDAVVAAGQDAEVLDRVSHVGEMDVKRPDQVVLAPFYGIAGYHERHPGRGVVAMQVREDLEERVRVDGLHFVVLPADVHPHVEPGPVPRQALPRGGRAGLQLALGVPREAVEEGLCHLLQGRGEQEVLLDLRIHACKVAPALQIAGERNGAAADLDHGEDPPVKLAACLFMPMAGISSWNVVIRLKACNIEIRGHLRPVIRNDKVVGCPLTNSISACEGEDVVPQTGVRLC